MDRDKLAYIAIDLKSFYASVECVDRGLDPLTTNLVVADKSRTEKTICLAVSPSLKSHGISGRARLFEVVARVKQVNEERKKNTLDGTFQGCSSDKRELEKHPDWELDYITATPRMARYMEYSTKIYEIYLQYVSAEDIHVYSIDEVFMDVSSYLNTYHMTAEELARKMMLEVLNKTGITATAGVGSNLYLCKIAMDIVAKHAKPDANGVRMGCLDERTYRKLLWNHKPITDFWRVGPGIARRLSEVGIETMGEIAKCSLGSETEFYNEDLLYRMLGVNAELLIDHAWGYEPVSMAEIKAYEPETNCVSTGQVLSCPYDYEKAKLIVKEMVELLALDLVDKGRCTDQIVLTIGYDRLSLETGKTTVYEGEVKTDYYGRQVPKHAHGTANLSELTASTLKMREAVIALYERIVDPSLLVRRINLTANHVLKEEEAREKNSYKQMTLFDLEGDTKGETKEQTAKYDKERKLQEAMLNVKKRYGKNAMLKGMNLEEGATTIERNRQIGGHKA